MSLDINVHNYESIDEPEQAQVHSIYYHLNQIAAIREKLNVTTESLKHCVDCGEEIPLRRREVIKGCKRCTQCQANYEQ